MPSSAVQTCARSEEHTSELQSHSHLVCRLLLEKQARPDDGEALVQPQATTEDTTTHHAQGALVRALPRGGGSHHRARAPVGGFVVFFLKEPATPKFYPLPLPDPLPT